MLCVQFAVTERPEFPWTAEDRAKWEEWHRAGYSVLLFRPEEVGRLVNRVYPVLLRFEVLRNGRIGPVIYPMRSWYDKGFQLQRCFRWDVQADWPRPIMQRLFQVRATGSLAPLAGRSAENLGAMLRGNIVYLGQHDAALGRFVVFYGIPERLFSEENCPIVLQGEVPRTQNEVVPLHATKHGSLALLTRHTVIYEAEHKEESLVFRGPEGMPEQMYQMAAEAYRCAISNEVARFEEHVQVLLQVADTVAKRVTRLVDFQLTQAAQEDLVRMLSVPEEIVSSVSGRIVDVNLGASGPMILVIEEDETEARHYVTLPRTAVLSDDVCESERVVRGSRIALAHTPVKDASDLDDDLIEAGFARCMVPLTDAHVGIPVSHLPVKLRMHLPERVSGLPVAYWCIGQRAVSLIIENGADEVSVGDWLKVNLRPMVEMQRRAQRARRQQ